MSETPQCPLPTPELVAALANQYIEELADWGDDTWGAMSAAFVKIVGEVGPTQDNRVELLRSAAGFLADMLSHPKPYETQVTLLDGSKMPPERHTITHFTDGEVGTDGQGFRHEDWAAISALGVGEAYVVVGASAVMTVTRKE